MKRMLLKDEYWWGGTVQDGIFMPYGTNQTTTQINRDLSKEQNANQTTPFLISNKGRYIWSEEPFAYTFNNQYVEISKARGEVFFSEGHGDLRGAYMDAASKFFPSTGKYPEEMLFTRPQYNLWIELMYHPTQEKVLEYASKLKENGFPTGVLTIDDNWQEDYGVWKFHEGRFRDPKSMVESLHKDGFKVMLWVCNLLSPDSMTSREAEQRGYVVKKKDGQTAIARWWNGYGTMLDVTNPEAVQWFCDTLDGLMEEIGIDGFKFDSGDLDQYGSDFVCKEPIDACRYSQLWAEIGKRYSLNEYRACWKQGGCELAQRLRDKLHRWDENDGLNSLIPNGLAQGIMGYAYSCPDMIGGGMFTEFLPGGPAIDEELIARNAQCAALFPMMQFSVAPWRILSAKYLTICRQMALLHEKMGSRILSLAREASTNNEPIMRYMEYEFPGCGYERINTQFMLGHDILVAPVLQKGAQTKEVIFPQGRWRDENGNEYQGPCTTIVEAPIEVLPWFQRVC